MRPCLVDGCWERTQRTYCERHRPKDSGDRHRLSQRERGYATIEYRINRKRVLQRDGWTCQYCGGVADTADHLIPFTVSGDNSVENLVAACRSCNSRKGART